MKKTVFRHRFIWSKEDNAGNDQKNAPCNKESHPFAFKTVHSRNCRSKGQKLYLNIALKLGKTISRCGFRISIFANLVLIDDSTACMAGVSVLRVLVDMISGNRRVTENPNSLVEKIWGGENDVQKQKETEFRELHYFGRSPPLSVGEFRGKYLKFRPFSHFFLKFTTPATLFDPGSLKKKSAPMRADLKVFPFFLESGPYRKDCRTVIATNCCGVHSLLCVINKDL